MDRYKNSLSNGKIKIRLYEPNLIVSNMQMSEDVAQEQLDAAFTLAVLYSRWKSLSQFFTGVPFGPGFIEHTALIRYGGRLGT